MAHQILVILTQPNLITNKLTIMRRIILFILALFGGYTVYHSVSGAINNSFNTVSITQLTNNPSLYSDSSFQIEATVLQSTTLLNCTKLIVADEKNSITLLSNKPFKKDEKLKLTVRLHTLYQRNDNQIIFLVDNNLKMIEDILPMLT
jgi:hypothetical protein